MHRFTTLSVAIRALLLAGAGLSTLPACAGYDVIASDETKLTFNLDASGLTIGTGDSEDLNLEQSHVGWKTGEWLDGYTTSFSVGRQDYQIGSGMLIADGSSDGGGGNAEYTLFETTTLGATYLLVDAQIPGNYPLANGNLMPGNAAKQWTGGDEDWLYSMIYVAYAY